MPLPHPRQQALHFQFLQLVAAVEQHQQKFRSQASVIDELVDIAFEVNPEGEGQGKGKERLGGVARSSYSKQAWHWQRLALVHIPYLTLQAGDDDYGK